MTFSRTVQPGFSSIGFRIWLQLKPLLDPMSNGDDEVAGLALSVLDRTWAEIAPVSSLSDFHRTEMRSALVRAVEDGERDPRLLREKAFTVLHQLFPGRCGTGAGH